MISRRRRKFFRLIYHVCNLVIKAFKKIRIWSLVSSLGGRCAYCGIPISVKDGSATLDHVVPRASGGTSRFTNAIPACNTCNNDKGNMTVHSFRIRYIKDITKQFYYETGKPVEMLRVARSEHSLRRALSKKYSGVKPSYVRPIKLRGGVTPPAIRENLIKSGVLKV